MANQRSLFDRAQKSIPSGVNSPVRAFKAVGGHPLFIKKAKGPWLWDEEGTKYLDFCASWGPMLFGHAPEGLIQAVSKALEDGTSFGAPTVKEVELAEKIRCFFPSMEKVRMTSSGTEAVMSAIRLARGFTGRKKILKIDGGYHGHVDSMLIKAGSGAATFGVPDSAGIPEELARLTLTVPFNDEAALSQIFAKQGEEIAAFVLEPIPANMGVVTPSATYLSKARTLTKSFGSLLIFDEVISGLRVGPSGAQGLYHIQPDLTCLGKIIGGGFPLAAFGGRAGIMDCLAPHGPVYQAGTLSGNPAAVTAALWTLDFLLAKKKYPTLAFWEKLNQRAEVFYAYLKSEIRHRALPLTLNTVGSMFTLFFTGGPVKDYASAKQSDTKLYAKFFHACLDHGLYLAPAQFEANFISSTHSEELLQKAFAIFRKALARTF